MGHPKYFETKGQKERVGFARLKIGLLSWLMSLSLSLFLFEKKNDDEKIMVTRYRTKK